MEFVALRNSFDEELSNVITVLERALKVGSTSLTARYERFTYQNANES